jgi:hypothetical protein
MDYEKEMEDLQKKCEARLDAKIDEFMREIENDNVDLGPFPDPDAPEE